MKAVGVKVFGRKTDEPSVVIRITPPALTRLDGEFAGCAPYQPCHRRAASLTDDSPASRIARFEPQIARTRAAQTARSAVGGTCITAYPHAAEAYVHAVYDPQGRWELSKRGETKHCPAEESWETMVTNLQEDILTSAGIEVPQIGLIYEVSLIAHMVAATDGSLKKSFEEKRHWS